MPSAGEVYDGVLIGYDQVLFLNDGGHHVVSFATGEKTVALESIQIFNKNIIFRRKIASEIGAKYLHVIVPDKQSVLQQQFPEEVKCCLGSVYTATYSDDSDVIYAKDFLKSLKGTTFLKTDTHLTHEASILLAAEIASRISGSNFDRQADGLIQQLEHEEGFSGDLGSKIRPQLIEDRLILKKLWPTTWLHNGNFDGNNGVVDIRLSPDRPLRKRVLIFGDSFGRDLGLFLSNTFEEVVFLRTPFFHEEIVRQMQPDVILTQCAERYLDSVISDDDRPSFMLYPHLGGKDYKPSAEFASAFSAILSFPRLPYSRFRTVLDSV